MGMIVRIKDEVIIGLSGAKLVSREAPPPRPKRVTTEIPHSNVVIDQSAITGQVFYERRAIKYVLQLDYENGLRDSYMLEECVEFFKEFDGCDLVEQGFGKVDLHFRDVWLESIDVSDRGVGRVGVTITVELSAYPWPKDQYGAEVYV